MEKKNLNVYEAPAVEIVEVEAQGVICASGESNTDGQVTPEIPDVEW